MDVHFEPAVKLIDCFEELLARHNISIPQNANTGDDMLSMWQILKFMRDPTLARPKDERPLLSAGAAMFDLAAKVCAVKDGPQFPLLLPHLKLLSEGAVHLDKQPEYLPDTYNKLIEIYWACLAMAAGIEVELDHPQKSRGGVDVTTKALPGPFTYEMKTLRSPRPRTTFETIEKAISQIETAAAKTGAVLLHLTPRIDTKAIWRDGPSFPDWETPATIMSQQMYDVVQSMINAEGIEAIEGLFAGKKAAPLVVCVAFGMASCIHPVLRVPTATPLKVLLTVEMPVARASAPLLMEEIKNLHRQMQVIGLSAQTSTSI